MRIVDSFSLNQNDVRIALAALYRFIPLIKLQRHHVEIIDFIYTKPPHDRLRSEDDYA